jgi:hypothetical protein
MRRTVRQVVRRYMQNRLSMPFCILRVGSYYLFEIVGPHCIASIPKVASARRTCPNRGRASSPRFAIMKTRTMEVVLDEDFVEYYFATFGVIVDNEARRSKSKTKAKEQDPSTGDGIRASAFVVCRTAQDSHIHYRKSVSSIQSPEG